MKRVLILLFVLSGTLAARDVSKAGTLRDMCVSAQRYIAGSEVTDIYDPETKKIIPVTSEYGQCIGYINGWVDVIEGAYVPNDDGSLSQYRLSNDVTVGQIMRLYVKYVNDHPEVEQKTSAEILAIALLTNDLAKIVPFKKPLIPHNN